MLINDLWTCFYSLCGRLDVRWNYAILPLLALIPLCATPAVCRQHMQVPGVEEPLGKLFYVLRMAQ